MTLETRHTHMTGQTGHQRCPRADYLSRYYQGKGVQKKGKSFEMITGSFAHLGIELLLKGLYIEDVVKQVIDLYNFEITDGSLITYGCQFEQVRQEQLGLIEALIRAWALRRLPYFLNEYEVIEVEQLHKQKLISTSWDEVFQVFKLDALFKHKETGLYSILSNKTTGAVDSRKQNDAKTDFQGLSEVWGIEQELGIKVNGVLMEYLLTGRKEIEEKPDGKLWIQWSPLIHGWFNPAQDEAHQIAWKYSWDGSDGKSHRLTKGYNRISAWDVDGGVKAWVDSFNKGEMFPSVDDGYIDPIDSQFVSIEYYRNEGDIEDWLEQIQHQERRTSEAISELKEFKDDEEVLKHVLNRHFPQYRHSCNYPSACQFKDICWGVAGLDPLMNGYEWRKSSIEREEERVAYFNSKKESK